MKQFRHSRSLKWLYTGALVLSLGSGGIVGNLSRAQSVEPNQDREGASRRDAKRRHVTLAKYARDLTRMARQGALAPVNDFAGEINRAAKVLARGTQNNPVLLDDYSAGRHLIAEGLAQRIVSEDAPAALAGKRVFSLETSLLIAGAHDEAEVEERWRSLLAEVAQSRGEVILFVDHLDGLIGAAASQGATVAEMMTVALERGELRVIGATTRAAFADRIVSDARLAGFFGAVAVGAASDERAETEDADGEEFVGDKVSPDLRRMLEDSGSANGRVSAILQVEDLQSAELRSLLERHGVQVAQKMSNLDVMAVELPVAAVEELAASDLVSHLSLDRDIESFGHVTKATGGDAARSLGAPTITTADGTDIGIAVVDSGIYDAHTSFLNSDGTKAVAANVNFVAGETITHDPYGHGTHVASLAAGRGSISAGAYLGVVKK